MYLLYLDESGNENDPNDRYFVLGGIALFERQTFFLTQDIEAIQDKYFPATNQFLSMHRLLQRRYRRDNDPQRGLLICSEGRFDARAKIWVKDFHRRGTQWGAINNLADIPYFAPANESRLLQAADLVAHATWLLYERREARLLRALLPAFDVMDGTLQGLAHMRAPARRNRRPPPSPRRLHLT